MQDALDLYAESPHVTHPFHPLSPPPLRSREEELRTHFGIGTPPQARKGDELDFESRTVCDSSKGHGFTMDANVVGGAHHVWIDLYADDLWQGGRYRTRTWCG
ncbi:hypothetical protein [Spongiactinospora sp. TRM90649]|uniref:hypothetical protein n=1 Tax=Spongiactinospora sp. TRM90649 TaxID=3031114 RepID=UPI0023F918A8|nr:hypothetical protein [Spongiactinospora sp. TRM90649]MDF5758348.1 hypothetical protein [Spongiactinospora sp. TRM90649]